MGSDPPQIVSKNFVNNILVTRTYSKLHKLDIFIGLKSSYQASQFHSESDSSDEDDICAHSHDSEHKHDEQDSTCVHSPEKRHSHDENEMHANSHGHNHGN